MKQQTIIVIGAGSFGTALGLTCHRANHNVTFLIKDETQAKEISENHTNTAYFPHLTLPGDIKATTDASILKTADAIVIAVPAQVLSGLAPQITHILSPNTPVILTSKGIIDADPTPLFPHDLVKQYLPNPLALLSGPNFAIELVDNLPAAAALATEKKYQKELCMLFAHPLFRLYPTCDYVGLQVAGVVKNILAIGCGMAASRHLGQNATAALITRGLSEMTRLGLKLGAKMETFLGLAGVGDLTLTCSSPKSRNFSLGYKLAEGKSIESILAEGHPLSEGYYSLKPILKLARAHSIDMPLCEAVQSIVDGSPLTEIIEMLFARPPRFKEFQE